MTVIAVDGPAGAGKSTVARRVAERLGWLYLDTGALFRALTLAAMDADVDLDDGAAVAALARSLRIDYTPKRLSVDGRDVTEAIRREEVTARVRSVARHPEVRELVAEWERSIAADRDVVVEGRDATTVVFPDAEFKFYLDADLRERARRRRLELAERGEDIPLEEVARRIDERDRSDLERAVAPLRVAEDAVVLDTTGLSIEEVVERVLARVRASRAR